MRRLFSRVLGAAAATGLATAGLVAAAAPAEAAACSGTSGVTVVIDTGSSTSTRCASGDPSSAMAALQAVAAVVAPQKYPGAVVCRIDGYPSASADPCVQMPPASAYWAFFHAPRGGSWTYSNLGVASYDPAAGSVIGFRFGSGQNPGVAPPAPTRTAQPEPTTAAPKPTPKATSTPKRTTSKPRATSTPKSTGSSTGSTGSSTGSGADPSSPSATATASPSSTASASSSASASASPSASDSATPSPAAGDGPSDGPSAYAAETTGADAGGGAGTGTLLAGGALVALVGGGAGYAAWRRRAA